MIKVGIAGVGFMGWIHYLAYQRVRGLKLTAFCSRDAKKRAGDWRGIKGNFGPEGEQIDVSGLTAYSDLDAMLADDQIDVVDLCLPPNLHVDATVKALKAGKHVFVEKPMALTTAECQKMCKAADAAGKQVLVGHVLPFFPEFAYAHKLATSGRYGKPIGGTFKRVISDPLWLKDFYDPQGAGGPLLDLHVHDAHYIRMLFGMPTAVSSTGRMRSDVVEYCNSVFSFEDPTLVVSAVSGVVNQQGRPFTHGFELHLEKATLQFELAAFTDGVEIMPLKVLTKSGKVLRPKLGEHDDISGFVGELNEVAKSIRSGAPSPILAGELARDAVVMCHKQTQSVQRGRPVKIR